MNKCNHIVLQGRLAFEPEVKTLASGKQLGKLRLACASGRGTLFIDVDVWEENLIGMVKQLHKGEEAILAGELRSNSWESPTGEKRMKHVVVAESLRSAQAGTQEPVFKDEAPF
jgi:single-stranded DNA-binding protein